jgi:hypothetical protein
MTTVVGYIRPPLSAGPLARGLVPTFERVAAADSLRLSCIYTDQPGRPGVRGSRTGFNAALAEVHARAVDGVLVLHLSDPSWHTEIRDTLAHLVTEAGGTLFVADEPPRLPEPVTTPDVLMPKAGNGHHPDGAGEPPRLVCLTSGSRPHLTRV